LAKTKKVSKESNQGSNIWYPPHYVKNYNFQAVSVGRNNYEPIISTNPYTDIDYQYFEEAWAYAGKPLDILMDFTMGGGIKPTLDLIDKKKKDEKQIRNELTPYKDILDDLMEIDNQPQIQFNEKLKAGGKLARVFGRGLIAFDPDGTRVPQALKIIHPRDLGRVYPKRKDWSVSSVDVNLSANVKDTISDEDMIYIVNEPDNPIRRNIGYGFSDFHRIVGAARSLQRFVEFDSPEMVETMWAGYGIIVLRPLSKSPTSDLSAVAGGLQSGQWNVINANPEDVHIEVPNLDPKVEKMVELMKFFQQIIIGNFQVPASLLGKEEEQTYATLLGRIRSFIAGPVSQNRAWLATFAEEKWYNRILRLTEPEAAKKIRIKAEFKPIIIESWMDNVEALLNLQKVIPNMPLKMELELARLEQYKDDIETEQKNTPPETSQPSSEINTQLEKNKQMEGLNASYMEQYATIRNGSIRLDWNSEAHRRLHEDLVPHTHVFIDNDGRRKQERLNFSASELIKQKKKEWRTTENEIIDDLTKEGKLAMVKAGEKKFTQT